MDLNKLKKLEPEIDGKSFTSSNSTANKAYFGISIFANIVAIILEFLFLYGMIIAIVPQFQGSNILVAIILAVGLSLYELLKRISIRKAALVLIKGKNIIRNSTVIVFSLVLITGSAWMGINGAHKISFKGTEIKYDIDQEIMVYSDSINSYYNTQILSLNDQLQVREERLLGYEGIEPQDRNWTVRSEINKLNGQVKELKVERNQLESERDLKVTKFTEDRSLQAQDATESSKDSSLSFVLIVAFIELIIIIGVVFNSFFDFKYYNEHTSSESFRIVNKHINFLKIVFLNGKVKQGEKIPTYKSIKEKCEMSNFIVSDSEIRSFIGFYGAMEIIKPQSGNNRRFNKTLEDALTIVTDYYHEN